MGAYFASHPAEQTATVTVEDPAHPSTAGLDPQWTRFDEWYNFQTNPRGEVHVLASVDESSYDPGGGAMGVEHPISWCHDYDGGRAWYTGMGHTAASYGEPAFLAHLLGGIETAAGATGADCAASLPGSFATVTLDDTTSNPMDLAVAGDGRVFYVIDWGSGFGGNNADSGVYRIDYLRGGNRPPAASLSADPASGPVPLQVAFSATGSSDLDGTPIGYQWDFDGDGTTDSTAETTTFTYTVAGDYTAVLTVTDADGGTDVATVDITAGNTAPSITVDAPIHGGFFDWGDTIPYEVTVTDPEDGSTQDGGIDCADVVTQPALGHDEHAHPYQQHFGCEGAFPLPGDEGHVGANLFGVVTVTYTDQGAPGVSPLTSQEVVVLQPKHKEAEYFTGTGQVPDGAGTDGPGVQTENTTDQGGGQNIGWISDGDWFGFTPMSLAGIDAVNFRVASGADGGRVEIHVDDPQGPLAGTAVVGGTGGWQSWTTVTAELNDVPAGSALYFVIRRPAGSGSTSGLLNVNWLELAGPGVGGDPGEPALSPNVHLFYYPWYGSPDIFGSWRHWQQGGHTPPEDIGADLYPALGPYDSGDPAAVDQHMSWVSQSGAGVIVYSWWGQGSYEDSLVPVVLDAAAAHGVTVAWHVEPYPGRTATSVVSDINYINAEYGDHPAYFRAPDQGDRPAFYIFHSLSIPDPDWAVLDQVTGANIVLDRKSVV